MVPVARQMTDAADRSLPGDRGLRAHHDLTPELRQRLYRFAVEAPATE